MVQSSKIQEFPVKIKSFLVPSPEATTANSFICILLEISMFVYILIKDNCEPCFFHLTMKIVNPENYM